MNIQEVYAHGLVHNSRVPRLSSILVNSTWTDSPEGVLYPELYTSASISSSSPRGWNRERRRVTKVEAATGLGLKGTTEFGEALLWSSQAGRSAQQDWVLD